MSILLTNAILADLDPIRVEQEASLRIDGDRIVARGRVDRAPTDQVIDCHGAVVLPGLVNGHTHLYSAFAVGMPPPRQRPRTFEEILEFVWWKLDEALDAESIEISARVGALQALRCGTTTLIDHHASPNCIDGSLDRIERGTSEVGLRGVLCYEATDRHGRAGREKGIDENRRYLTRCAARRDGRFAGLVGAHASFTLDDESLSAVAALAGESGTGVHIHVAEDPCDERETGGLLIDRLDRFGLLVPNSLFAHGTHLSKEATARVNAAGLTLAHNARSNMNNAVGYAPIGKLTCPVMLGTDGIGGDMFAEAKAAWFKSRDGGAGISPARVIEMLATGARRASAALGAPLGKLEVGAAADIVVTDYVPFTSLTSENLPGHFLFVMDAGHVRDVVIGGRWAVRDRAVVSCDQSAIVSQAKPLAQDLWRRAGFV